MKKIEILKELIKTMPKEHHKDVGTRTISLINEYRQALEYALSCVEKVEDSQDKPKEQLTKEEMDNIKKNIAIPVTPEANKAVEDFQIQPKDQWSCDTCTRENCDICLASVEHCIDKPTGYKPIKPQSKLEMPEKVYYDAGTKMADNRNTINQLIDIISELRGGG